MAEFTYIYDGQTYTDTRPEFMAALGMDEETIRVVSAQRDYECTELQKQRREAAYAIESDKLSAEALRKYFAGDEEGLEAAKAALLAKVLEIQNRYPIS